MEIDTHQTLAQRSQHCLSTHTHARAHTRIIYWEILMVNFHSMPFGARLGEKWTHFIVAGTWKYKTTANTASISF